MLVEKEVENSAAPLSDSDFASCQTDLKSCKDDLRPCRPPPPEPSIFPVFHHFYSILFPFFLISSPAFRNK